MNLLIGLTLILGMLMLIFFGPEWALGLKGESEDFKDFKKSTLPD